MKRKSHPTRKPARPVKAGSRHRARAGLQAVAAQAKQRPMLTKLYRRAEVRLRQQRRNPKSKASVPKSDADPQRQFHELQVHQVELEMQNTELQEARDRMEVLLEKYTDLYDFAPVGYLSLDESGVILEANLTGAALLGVERSRLINRRLPLLVSPASRPDFLAFLHRVFAGTGRQVCEVMLIREDGASFWGELNGTASISPDGPRKWCRVAVSDITVLKQVEEVQGRMAAIVQSSDDAIIGKDLNGIITSWNAGAERILGFSAGEMLGTPILRLIPADRRAAEKLILGKIRAGKSVQHFETQHQTKDGRLIDVSITFSPIKNTAGKVIGVSKVARDITERKHAEEARRRFDVLTASNRRLELEIVRRRAGEKALRESERHQRDLLAQSHLMQEKLRQLSRQVLRAQEEERKRISRELHDVIAQTLTGINVHLAALKKEATINTKGLDRNIARTQRLVQKSVDIVHQFARELRPAVLDDLGLIPALHSFMKSFSVRTGIRTRLTAFAGVEQLDSARRTALYRVAQEALTNVSRHAQATQTQVDIQKLDGAISMRIKDNGKGFQPERVSHSLKRKRLGLLGMSERLEMVKGRLTIESAPGKGTTIQARIPFADVRGGGGGALT